MTKTLHALFSVTFPPRLLLACVSSGSSSTIGHLIENSGAQISLCQEEGNDLLPSILVKVCLVYLLCSLESKDGPEVMTHILQLCSWSFAVVLLLFFALNGVSAVPLKASLALTIL